jgi:hypothetical protein
MANQTETPETRPTDAAGNPVYRIPEENFPVLQERITKLNRRAAKLSMHPLVLTETGEEFETHHKMKPVQDATGPTQYIDYQVRFVMATVTGTCPRVNGWTFAATIEHDPDGNILRVAPGFEVSLPLQYRTATTACEHCHTQRIRKDTYILQSEDGDWKQVGRNCLADFLRCEDPSGIAQWAEVIAGLDDEIGAYEEDMGFGGRQGTYLMLPALLTQVACCVRNDGWCSRTEARESYIPKIASVDQALAWFEPKYVREQSEAARAKYAPTEADEAKALAAIEWAQNIAADVANDYLWNIRVVSHKEAVKGRDAGLAGSIIVAYQKHIEAEIARKYERDHPSEYFGTVGKREVFTLTVIGLREIESDYGCTTLVMFRDAVGNKAKWFCSGEAEAFELDKTLTVKATVKAHEEYKSSKQTQLSRVALWDEAAEKAAKVARAAAKKIIKARYTCPHDKTVDYGRVFYGGQPQAYHDLPAELTEANTELPAWVPCCPSCDTDWTARDAQTQTEAA